MKTLCFDTEFVWVPGCEREDRDGTERTPHPPNATIESIGWVSLTYGPDCDVKLGTVEAGTERERVQRFVSSWGKQRPRLVSFNGRGADIPLVVARLMHHGIRCPEWAGGIALAYRYRHEAQLDLADVLGSYGAQRRGGLSDWARCVGWPGKVGVDGSQVAGLLQEPGGRAKVDAYCLCDAVQTAAVLLRYELILGTVEIGEYHALARALLAAALQEPRTEACAAAVDRDAWLLGAPETKLEGAAA